VLQALHLAAAGGLTPQAVIANVASGGIGGAVVLVVISIIKGMMAGKA
jgi:hypothetical protein